ncbi:putative integral membrane protein [Streptomyces himastatinicus ATCC 53653]|uniref:Putative integral membrane protein n=1 Tax=Streptomyces himastatinicus ATCC 53653 TaxID=457427 RepID=D9W704_9ACTN|nr:putative integral membrane protein [Streptomyces himastatinicus ATCC 53653]
MPASDPQPEQQSERHASSPLPSERAAQPQPERPYHPPQAYAPPPGGGAAASGRSTSAQPAVPGQQPPGAAARRPGPGTGGGAPAARPAPRTRKARLRVAKVDPWSVMKVSFLLAIALGICTVVAASVLWMVMDAMGVFSAVGGTISEATEGQQGGGFDLESFLSLPHVMTFTSVIAVINVVLATALATLGAFIYNLSAGFVGGVELTLAEDE